MSESTANFRGCGAVSNLVRGLGAWFRGSCWSHAPSGTSTCTKPSSDDITSTTKVVINQTPSDKNQCSLEEKSASAPITCPSPSPSPSSVSRRLQHASSCAVESGAGLPPIVFSITSKQPIMIAFTNTDTTATVFPMYGSSSSLPSVCKHDLAVGYFSPEEQKLHKVNLSEFGAFQLESLAIHNKYRELHGVPPLRLNKKMCEFAGAVATALCGNTRLPPPPFDRKYGETVLVVKSPDPITAREGCNRWYDQSQHFEFGVEPKASKSRKSKCSFTQMIWKGTRELGIGTAHMDGTGALVGLYYPAGNVPGQYVNNCPRPVTQQAV